MTLISLIREKTSYVLFFLRGAFWAIPATLLILAGGLALVTLWLDLSLPTGASPERVTWLNVDKIRDTDSILTTTAAAILGVAGVSFSVTIASLTLASQQFGPRLIRNFIKDRFTQTVLGFFVATFLFCMLSNPLAGVAGQDSSYVPVVTLAVTLVLTIVDLLLLVLFFHHICVSIQADYVINGVFTELRSCIANLLPNDGEHENTDVSVIRAMDKTIADQGKSVRALSDGYIQHIDSHALVAYCQAHSLKVRFNHRAGDYLLSHSVMAYVQGDYPAHMERQINRFVSTGFSRSPRQDLEYCLRQLVEVALRALSPSVNDPFTAMTCIDRLGAGLSNIANRPMRSPAYHDSDGEIRLILYSSDYQGLVDTAFNQIRQAARGHVDVTIRLLEILSEIIPQTKTSQQAAALHNQAQLIFDASVNSEIHEYDQNTIRQRFNTIAGAVNE
jgi:uncharacterized membrane protein